LVYSLNMDMSKKLLYSMKKIRLAEFAIAKRYSEQQMRCPVHLSVGQEGVAAAVGCCLRDVDYAVSGHRAHAHYLAKGASLKGMIAEIYGQKTGCSSGKGGSMHLIDTSVGFMGSTAIVGGTIPVGVGLGLAAQRLKEDRISCVFLGDGAVEEGVFYESANFAVLHKLPVLFICENNNFSVYTPLKYRQPESREIYQMVAGIGMQSEKHTGNDVELVYKVTSDAIKRIKVGKGPQFLEFTTWRWLEHCGPNEDDDLGYRNEVDNQHWRKQDPVALYEKLLLSRGEITFIELEDITRSIEAEVVEAFEFALASPFPELHELAEDIYE